MAETPAQHYGQTLSWPVLPQADAGSTTLIRVDEPDAGLLKRPPQGGQDRASRLRCAPFELANRDRANFGCPRQIILGPIEQGSGSTALGRRHRDCIA